MIRRRRNFSPGKPQAAPSRDFSQGTTSPSRSPFRGSLLLGLLAFLLLAGCALKPALPPPPGKPSPYTPESRWQQLQNAQRAPVAMKALARIDLTTPSGRYPPFKVAFLLQAPDSFRLESLPLFGPPDFYLSLQNGEMQIFLPQEGKYYVGPPSRKALAAYLPFLSPGFGLSDLLVLLRGAVPLVQNEDVTLNGFQERDVYRLEVYRGEEKVQEFWLAAESNELLRASRWDKGELLYTARFEGYGGLKEAAGFPAEISVTTGQLEPTTLKIRYKDLQFPRDLSPALFSLEVPPGIEPLRLNGD